MARSAPACLIPTLALLLLAGGCIGTSTLSRVKTTKSADGTVTTTRTPIPARSSSSSSPSSSGDRTTGLDVAAGVLDFLFNLQDTSSDDGGDELWASDVAAYRGDKLTPPASSFRPTVRETEKHRGAPPPSDPRIHYVKKAAEEETAAAREAKPDAGVPIGLQAAYVRTRIWTGLRTYFNSSSIPNISWDESPKIGGSGGEASLLLWGRPTEYAPVFGEGVLKVGYFDRSYVRNTFRNGAFYVNESIKSRGYWTTAAIRVYLKRPVFISAMAGAFYYRLKTGVDTNVPAFTYEGVTGDRVFGALGFGGGLRTPWDFPLQGIFEGSMLLNTSDDTLLDSAVGQMSVGLVLAF